MKHKNGVYKGMKWCYVADIEAHLDDIATDIRANIEKVFAYDALMAKKEEIKKEQAIIAEHEANIVDIRQQIDELQNALLHETVLVAEAQERINALKEEFWK
jgi:chromosome segregation ATPase